MSDRPFVLLSCATSVDGYIDDMSHERLRLSNTADLDRLDAARAGVDAILVGANTVRRDDPSLLIKSAARRAQRVARGLPEDLTKVTMTAGGDIDPGSRFFTTGTAPKIVYAAEDAAPVLAGRLGELATVVDMGTSVELPTLLADLAARGVRRLMVEGGGSVHTRFLTAGLVDEIHLVIAPFFVGDPGAPRFTHPGVFPQSPGRPMRLEEARRIGEVAFLRYTMGNRRG
ncbi:RibD family protein [Actinocorallia longicatena]|uniref:Bacterial bifunctional deaminase-reductase C-terminal domain-containing protein n=1 Tax=Actinocorallia longicatena TaxID=111803 RepID=A0ABP6QGT4_9ACTN